jgi:hypothetical protein
MWTPRFERFVAPARARPQLWRLILGVLLIGAIMFLAFIIVSIGLRAVFGQAEANAYLSSLSTGGTPTLVVMMLAMFIWPLLGAIVVVRMLHRRSVTTVFGPGLLRDFFTAAAIAALVFVGATLVLPMPFDPVPNVPMSLFLSFLPLAVIAIGIQTFAEEVVFRGYMQQQLAARFRNPLIWMLIPAVFFGSLHSDPFGGVDKLWLMLPPTLFGLIAADLTRVTGSIGAGWGLHFTNNASAILILSLDGNLSGLALYRTPFGVEALSLSNPLVWQEMLITVIVWASIRLWLARGGAISGGGTSGGNRDDSQDAGQDAGRSHENSPGPG